MPIPDLAHMTATLAEVPADFAFRLLSDPAFVGGWSLGSMDLSEVAEGIYRGTSLFDGSAAHVDIRPVPALGIIDFGVGSLTARTPRIYIRVTPGPDLGHPAECCQIALQALRAAGSPDDRWARTCITHEAEILLIKAQLETAFTRTRA